MLEEKEVKEECLYCHGQISPSNPCPFCGDARLAESLKSDPSTRPTLMFPLGPIFDTVDRGSVIQNEVPMSGKAGGSPIPHRLQIVTIHNGWGYPLG